MHISNKLSNAAVLEEIGRRLHRQRLHRNITQRALAGQTGLAIRTIVKAEQGEPTTLPTLVAILRGLDLLGQLDQFLPDPPLSPIQLAKLEGKPRQRASRKGRNKNPPNGTWKWSD